MNEVVEVMGMVEGSCRRGPNLLLWIRQTFCTSVKGNQNNLWPSSGMLTSGRGFVPKGRLLVYQPVFWDGTRYDLPLIVVNHS